MSRTVVTRARPRSGLALALALAAFALVAPAGEAALSSAPAPDPSWVVRFSPGGFDLGEGVALDEGGNTYVTGIADDGAGDLDFVTVKFAPDGAHEWTRNIDRGKGDRGEDVVVDAQGNVYVAGAIEAFGGDDVVIQKYDSDGNGIWSATFDKGTSETSRGLAVDDDGNLFLAGTALSMNGADGFVAKFTSGGEEVWSRPINLYYLDEVFDVAADGEGNSYVVGRALRDGSFDTLVRKFSPSGVALWTKFITNSGRDEARGVVADRDGNAYVVGTTTTFLSRNTSHLDVLVTKFTPDGSIAWSKPFDLDGGDDEGRDGALDRSGNILVTGFGPGDRGKDPVALKLTPGGEEIWRERWSGAGIDGTGAVATAASGGRIVIAGASQREGTDFDYLVIAYDEGAPSAAFRVASSQVKADAPVAFEDASAPGRADIVSWAWDFGDGATSSEPNPTHAYAWGGEYPVTLVVRDAYYNVDEYTSTLHVDGPPRPGPATPPRIVPDAPEEEAGGGGWFSRIPAPSAPLAALVVVLAALALAGRGRA